MRRREFITLVGGVAVACPLAARAQQHSMPVVGWLGATPTSTISVQGSFQRGLSENGFDEGRNLAIEYRWPQSSRDRLSDLAADLVRRQVNVIFAAGGEPVAIAAKTATSTIPIVVSAVDDPVRLGLVASLNRPGGNITGMSIFNSETNAKRFGLLRDLVPKATTLPLLVWPVPDIDNQIADVSNATHSLGISLHVVDVQKEGGLEAAFETRSQSASWRATVRRAN